MSLPNELHPLQLAASSGGGYEIEQSLRFNGSDSAYLINSTPSTDGNRKTYTISVWVKKVVNSGTGGDTFFYATADASNIYAYTSLSFGNADAGHLESLRFLASDSGASQYKVRESSDAAYRDYSAWMHVVAVMDTTQSTAADRVKIYVNGEQITDLASSYAEPAQDYQNYVNGNNAKVQIGRGFNEVGQGPWYFDGYLAEYHLVDGTALEPTDFGEYDESGVWRPIEYTGSYGTNGFYLKFDPSATNGIGHDHSGNGNNFTASGFSTSGAGTDVMSDTPTTNWCTLNPLDSGEFGGGITLSEGNLKAVSTSSDRHVRSTFFLPTSGKWYWEMTATTVNTAGYLAAGLYHATGSLTSTAVATAQGRWYAASGYGNGGSWGATYDDGDIIGIAVDMDSGKIWAAKNNTWQASGDPAAGTNPMYDDLLTAYSDIAWSPVCANWQSGNTADFNFGQREFLYPPGTSSATNYFNTVTYTGNNSTNAITGVGFAPDFVWIKPRSTTDHHRLNDTIRGVNKTLSSNLQNSEYGPVNAYLDSFDSDGFTVSSSDLGWNNSSHTYVAWCWNAGGTTASNTDGSITSSIRANQDAGFSIVTWSGSTANGTVGHGLGTAPGLIIFKRRNATTSWPVYTSILGASQVIYLNETAAKAASGNSFGSSPTDPTSTVFSVGDKGDTNYDDMLAYCWAEKPGVTKIGSYEGNGLASGLSVDVGFRPAMVIIKNADAVDDWNIIDNRTPPNANLRPNSGSAEDSAVTCYLTPTGFTVATGNSHRINFANETFIYIAFAENFSADATYKALNTANLPAPDIKDGSDYFNTVLYTGTGSNLSITGVGFQPDWNWIKKRSASEWHAINDAVRGAGLYLSSNTTNAESDANGVLNSFDSDGFTVGTQGLVNDSGATYVAWNWLAANGTSSNTDGSITSTVSANPSAGFSIVSWSATLDSTSANTVTIGHGLGIAPDMIIQRPRNTSSTWQVYHSALGTGNLLMLNNTNAVQTAAGCYPSVTSTVWTPGDQNYSGGTYDYINYCFAEVEGYSKFGSYTGNGSSDGPFIYCGFKPAWIMYKKSSSTGNWIIHDTTRSEYNVTTNRLFANLSNAEGTSTTVSWDILSNGAKIRTTDAGVNGSGDTFIFMALAENPFGGSGISPATAR